MKIVHGFRGGFPVFGVRTPVLPCSTGLFTSSEGMSGEGFEPSPTGRGAGVVVSGMSGVGGALFSDPFLFL